MADDLFDCTGQVAVVTGGTGVLGGTMARGLADAGARVAILGRREEKANEVVESIEDRGGTAMAAPADVLERDQLEEAREAVLDRWGRVDTLVHAAGGNQSGATVGPDEEWFDAEWGPLDAVVRLNLQGTFYASQAFGAPMAEQGSGSIIHVSSMAAQKPLTRVVGYSAAKAGVDNFTEWLAVELAEKYGEGLRVNAIAPGFFIGEQNRDLLLEDDGSLTDRGRTIVEHTPMDRFGEPEDLIGTVVWLSSRASRFVTGTVVPVDGGFSAFGGV